MRRITAVLFAAVLLAGCDQAAGPAFDQDPGFVPVPSAANVAPGSNAVGPEQVESVLNDVCLETLPRFRSAPAAISQAGGFVQNSDTGTYYHQRLNLSVKIVKLEDKPGCSIVFAYLGNPVLLDMLAQSPDLPNATVILQQVPSPEAVPYYRMLVFAGASA